MIDPPATQCPDISREWDFAKNAPLAPENVKPNSNKPVWWKCDAGHSWSAVVSNRSCGDGCPYCAGRMAIQGENDLATLYPDIAAQWNGEKNGDKVPNQFLPTSSRKVWWRCSHGHEWKTSIASRTAGIGCPFCSKRTKARRKLI